MLTRVGLDLRAVTVKAGWVNLARMASSKVNYDHFWMPFTDNTNFKKDPRIFERAEGVYYYTEDGRQVLDGMSGLWCVNAGHGQPKIVKAIQDQAAKLDFVPSFNTSHKLPYQFSEKILELLPGKNFTDVFFTMCGSTAVDTALKMALQYHRSRGEGGRVRFIGRERAYHGVGFGGISVGGLGFNRKAYSGNMLPYVDHLPHTHSIKDAAFSKGLPTWGAHLAEDLERIVALHDASTIAAVIIEPVGGSTGVLPPPVGYLQRIREICDKHNILLIFDEVITGFGRLGDTFATTKFNVVPDMITCAKGLTNASVPCGAVISQQHIFQTLQQAAHKNGGPSVEMFHGYTYSGHPLAMAAGIATLEVYKEQKIFENAARLAPLWEKKLHSLRDFPHVVDIRNVGLMGAVEVTPAPGAFPALRCKDVFDRCFFKGLHMRYSNCTLALSPPLVCEEHHLDKIVEIIGESLKESAVHFKP